MPTVTSDNGETKYEGFNEIPLDDWLAECKKRFGDDSDKWAFVCPNCGHVQTVGDFHKLHDQGIKVNAGQAYFSCIGRYLDGKCGTIFDKKAPCNYTLGGLFVFAKTVVIDHEGNKHPVFEFAPEGGH
ncbi:MAG: VVA0879 family protein [Methanomassiliicoccales archaeon]|jgi:hypothetical protein